ncbi:diguanylate cyclase [Cryobacterium sp. CG_9.6]|uniref:diguanylate cyclase domain-containing protein n=1 Tax=Cryobacterium sp. CG_9.6 TaxID=2760710 RepID=UPI00247525AC|nr:diguanylate cyclase [Cryobacterium sp. CG_9.6]MDH6236998.1 diguanylate cyclase (GGDEF)-like protein/PAS domain S-box-containing protein [Cryobacterium sp. CG_9.6]
MPKVGRVIAGAVGLTALLVLFGWYAGISVLTEFFPGYGSIKPTAAAAVVLISLSTLLMHGTSTRRTRLMFAFGGAAALAGALTLVEYIFGPSLGIDTLMPGIDLRGDTARMAPTTAASLLVLGGAVLSRAGRRPGLTLGCALISLGLSLMALLGYLYNVSSLYTIGGATSMALPTALSLTVLSGAVLLQYPSHGLLGVARESGSGGQLLRLVLPTVLFGPALLGFLLLAAQQSGWFDTRFAIASLVLMMTLLGCIVGWLASRRLRVLDHLHTEATAALFHANRVLEETVTARTRELSATAASLQSLIQLAPVGILQFDAEGRATATNERWVALSSVTDERTRAVDCWTSLLGPDDVERVHAAWGDYLTSTAPFEDTVRFRLPNGQENWVQITAAPIVLNDAFVGHLGSVTDVTALRAAEARVKHLAFHDPLTDLPNRLRLLESLNAEMRQARKSGTRIGVLFLDLDGFKAVNDTLGHQAGDAVLIEVAARIRRGTRTTDTISRIGGDEFVVVFPDIRATQDLVTRADALQELITRPISLGAMTVTVGVSIGMAWGAGEEDPEKLLHRADQDMYLAKARGRAASEILGDDARRTITSAV